MNKIVTFIIILIEFVQVSFAQIQFKDSTKAYNYWAKRGVIEATYSYVQDQEKVSFDEKQGKELFKQKFVDNKTTSNYDSISSFLKSNNWENTAEFVFQPLDSNYKNKVTLDTAFFEIKAKDGSNYSSGRWKETIKDIIGKYNNSINNIDLKQLQNKTNQGQTQKVNRDPKKIDWNKFLFLGGIFIVGVLIGSVLIVLITKNRIKSIINEEGKEEYDNYLHEANNSQQLPRYLPTYLRVVYYLHKQKNKYKKESETANRNNNELEKQKKELSDKNSELANKLKENKRKSEIDSDTSFRPPTKKITEIYFSIPESDGSFQISNGETYDDGQKYFKIEPGESSAKGELFYLSGDRDQRAINRLESYLKPVCDIGNITNSSSATKIELIHSGKVSRLNDRWVIDPDNKIKIKLY